MISKYRDIAYVLYLINLNDREIDILKRIIFKKNFSVSVKINYTCC